MVELLALYGEDGSAVAYLEDGTPVIFGEDEDILGASFLSRLKRGVKKASRFTPQGMAYAAAKNAASRLKTKKVKRLFGADDFVYVEGEDVVYVYGEDAEDVEVLGKFLPGLMKAVKKVGKVTSKITTGAARAVGVPQSVINALAKVDPSKKGGVKPGQVVATIIPSVGPSKEVVAVPSSTSKMNIKNIAIIAGAGVGGVVLLSLLLSRRRS